ncbi:helix-turn-helix domain-containing protein [Halobaculum limi]|uniref:helix-turn-helix domain-containing protein n=1 Tax=Halobaculum limi TaxID=3031916 RepID=UPI002406EE9E|nr:helix-turn-helix domain-containing protein [Halobaculum sp. YSMS11]
MEAEFREYALGRLPDQEHRDVHPVVGMIPDKDVRHYVMFCAEAYDPGAPEYDGVDMPRDFWDTDFAQEIIRKYGTDVGTTALEMGNIGQLQYFSGLVGYKSDVSGMQTLMKLQQLIEKFPVFILYIYAAMGFGKTDFALLMIEVFHSVYGEENVLTASNIGSWDEGGEYIDSYEDYIAWLKEGRDDDNHRIFILDEGSQNLTGSGSDQKNQQTLAKMLKLARKYGGHLIIIGHDGKDVGPGIRALASAVVQKDSKKEATFYHDVKDRQGIGEILSLSKIPQTSMTYDTEDISTWSMGEEDDDGEEVTQADLDELEEAHERRIMALLSVTTDMSQAEVGSLYGVSDRTVRRAKQKYGDELADLGLV